LEMRRGQEKRVKTKMKGSFKWYERNRNTTPAVRNTLQRKAENNEGEKRPFQGNRCGEGGLPTQSAIGFRRENTFQGGGRTET